MSWFDRKPEKPGSCVRCTAPTIKGCPYCSLRCMTEAKMREANTLALLGKDDEQAF